MCKIANQEFNGKNEKNLSMSPRSIEEMIFPYSKGRKVRKRSQFGLCLPKTEEVRQSNGRCSSR